MWVSHIYTDLPFTEGSSLVAGLDRYGWRQALALDELVNSLMGQRHSVTDRSLRQAGIGKIPQ